MGKLTLDKNKIHQIYIGGRSLLANSIQLSPTHDVNVQIVRSLIVSVIALIFDFGALVFLKESLGVHYLLAAALSFCLGVVVNYYLSRKWVFAYRKFSRKRIEFPIFMAICVIGLGLNLAIISGLVQSMGVDYRIAKLVSTVVVFFWNFVARKRILY